MSPERDLRLSLPRRAPVLSIVALAVLPLSLIGSALVMLVVQRTMVSPTQAFSEISRAGVFTLLGCIGLSLVLALVGFVRSERPRMLSVLVFVLVIILVVQFAGNQYHDPQFGLGAGAPR